MADFLIAFERTNKNEGGYANDPQDRGGETWGGISRVFWPKWKGWPIIDAYKQLPNFPHNLNTSEELRQAKQDFYKTNFWDRIRGDELKSQAIANDFYDMAVNMGTGAAIGIEQESQGLNKNNHINDNLLNHLNNIV